jgi:SAM-dependent methyltransferase
MHAGPVMSEPRGIKSALKKLIRRAFRPAIWPIEERIATIETRMNNQAVRLQAINVRTDNWSRILDALPQRLDRVEDALERISGSRMSRDKHAEELSYWRWLIKTEQGRASIYAPFEIAFRRWQRDRLRELARCLKLAPEESLVEVVKNGNGVPSDKALDRALDQWCAGQSVVEIGAGPYPAIAAAPAWKRAVAVDPLAKSYAEENLLPAAASHVTYIEASGERIPLPPGFADLVIIENALDHVSEPALVLTEIRRLLRPGGLVWLLVDLSTHTDHMHPHAFDEAGLREVLKAADLEVIHDRTSSHKSHPKAFGEFRALLRKSEAGTGARRAEAPAVVVQEKPRVAARSQ